MSYCMRLPVSVAIVVSLCAMSSLQYVVLALSACWILSHTVPCCFNMMLAVNWWHCRKKRRRERKSLLMSWKINCHDLTVSDQCIGNGGRSSMAVSLQLRLLPVREHDISPSVWKVYFVLCKFDLLAYLWTVVLSCVLSRVCHSVSAISFFWRHRRLSLLPFVGR